MTFFAITPKGKVVKTDSWDKVPKEVVFVGDCKNGLAGEFDYYLLRHGRVTGTNTYRRLKEYLGCEPEGSHLVKLGTDVPDDDYKRMHKLAIETAQSLKGGC